MSASFVTSRSYDPIVDDGDFAFIQDLVRNHSGINLEQDKRYLVESRLSPVVRRERLPSLRHLVALLRRDPRGGLYRRVAEAMITNETSFFRDWHPFELVRTRLLPALIEQRRTRRSLRIWCAACSSGQEPYSVAMLIDEHFPELAGWTVEILGTDVSTHMVRRSQEGRYSQLEVNRGLPAPFLVKYFDKIESDWEIDAAFRKHVVYRQMNLVDAWPALERWDIIFLRNVLIYFTKETKQAILDKTAAVLQPDGYLLLGGAESTVNLSDEFERMPITTACCYQPRRDRSL